MGKEEQAEEREVLQSIYPDEITGKSYAADRRLPSPSSLLPC